MNVTIKGARVMRGMSQDDVAAKMNVHVQTYRKLEENPERMTVGQMMCLSAILDMPYDDIILNCKVG